MKHLLELLVTLGLDRLFAVVRDIVKRRVARLYINVVYQLRNIYFIFALTTLCLLLFVVGFLLLHLALFLYLPWDFEDRVLLIFILGLIYSMTPLALMIYLHSRRRWL